MAPDSQARRRQRRSAGILLYRFASEDLEVLLVHPGGPFWARRDAGVWSIPKGEHEADEEPLIAARREFAEELGTEPPAGQPLDLGEVRQKSGKYVHAWALEGDLDATAITSNSFALEWPPRSGRTREFPEVDRAQWFGLRDAREKLNPGQVPLLDRLAAAQPGGREAKPTRHQDQDAQRP
jgi:predicted NUDIX family NTP pyrophosphohydrolase